MDLAFCTPAAFHDHPGGGLGRESLYKALSPNGNTEFATVLKVMCALGLRLRPFAASGHSAG